MATASFNHAALAEYEQFREDLLPALRKDLLGGMTADAIRKKYEAHAAARLIQIATLSENESAAVTAGKDIQDRSSGKPKEHKRVEHLLAQLPAQEFEAVLRSELESLKEIEEACSEEDEEEEG